jgi:7-cyano-7-deazaguanine synthase
MKSGAIVLLSGGLDSTVNFYATLKEANVKMALTFDYGQKAAKKEIEAAAEMAKDAGVTHTVISLDWFKGLGTSALNTNAVSVPKIRSTSLDDKDLTTRSAKAVWVPNRNGLFLNIAACYAESLQAEMVVPGFNREEATTFPDNSLDFIRATRKAFGYSTANQVDVQCYTITMSKIEIVELGKKLNVPFSKVWPCYFDREKWCGECESCQRAKRAFKVCKVDVGLKFEKF